MFRAASILALLLCCAAVEARAEASDPPAHSPTSRHAATAKAARRPRAKGAGPQASRPAAEPIVGAASPHGDGGLAGPAPRASSGEAWSVSPEWSASNGGSSAAYGTRALVNELHTNPAETTGYGAGAKVDFHF